MSSVNEVQKPGINLYLYREMQRNAAVLTVVCIMMCLTFNYTFPLHRKTAQDTDSVYYPNQTQECKRNNAHHDSILERSKKMTSNIENALKRFKDSTQDFGKNIYDHVSSELKGHMNIISEEDLRQYEQMVIMKKYPYLDLKELEQKYSPVKNTRQSLKFEHNPNVENDPGLCEPLDDSPNVEITNRGLTGFAIPPELSKHVSVVEGKAKLNNLNNNYESKLEKKSSLKDVIRNLKSDIEEYVENKNAK